MTAELCQAQSAREQVVHVVPHYCKRSELDLSLDLVSSINYDAKS